MEAGGRGRGRKDMQLNEEKFVEAKSKSEESSLKIRENLVKLVCSSKNLENLEYILPYSDQK